MTGEEIRQLITSDYENAKQLLESSRFFRVISVDENGEGTEFDSKDSAQAIEFFENKRDSVEECFVDVMTGSVEFKGKEFEQMGLEIANSQDQRLRKEVNYVQVQQLNRGFLSKLLEGSFEKLNEQETRIGKKIVQELLQIDYPL